MRISNTGTNIKLDIMVELLRSRHQDHYHITVPIYTTWGSGLDSNLTSQISLT